MDRGAWWATVYRVAKSQTSLSDWAHYTEDKSPSTQCGFHLLALPPFTPPQLLLSPHHLRLPMPAILVPGAFCLCPPPSHTSDLRLSLHLKVMSSKCSQCNSRFCTLVTTQPMQFPPQHEAPPGQGLSVLLREVSPELSILSSHFSEHIRIKT